MYTLPTQFCNSTQQNRCLTCSARTNTCLPARRQPNAYLQQKARMIGISLVELCIVVLLMTSGMLYAQPALRDFIEDARAITLTNHLISLLHYSRIQALIHQKPITLCRLEANTCLRPWRKALTVFIDRAPIGKLDARDKILLTSRLPALEGVIHWQSFRRKPYINFTPLGETHSQNGHLVTCVRPGASATARKIVINRQGRTRLARRTKNVGSHKTSIIGEWAKRC
jgi:Tfp pilus assembly protein FimT